MSTFMAKKETIKRQWFVIDAADQVVGRLAVVIANILRGKHKPEYTPHIDSGDFVIVLNADKVRFTGTKWDSKTYSSYSHYPGGLKVTGAREILRRKPEFILFQCGADSLDGDPLAHLKYSPAAHAHAARSLCQLANELAGGRIMGFGGGGYNRGNLALAWNAVLREFIQGSER